MKKFFENSGATALKLWLFSLGTADLERCFDQNKANHLWAMVRNYYLVLKDIGSTEEQSFAKDLLERIPYSRKIPKGVSINTSAEKVWMCGLALDVLERNPNSEKLKMLRSWLEMADDYLQRSTSSNEYRKLRARITSLANE